jgi:hypothetical protein
MGRGWKVAGVVVAGVVVACLLAGCGGNKAAPPGEAHDLRGTVALHGSYGQDFTADPFGLDAKDEDPVGRTCVPLGGYADLAEDQVTVKDEGGTVLGVGTLGGGTLAAVDRCEFHFVVRDLPRAAFYQLEVGQGRRGTLRYRYAELAGMGWKVSAKVG